MSDPRYFVYYSTANNRPKKDFGHDGQAAMKWAQDNADKDTEVVKCQVVWSAREDKS